MIRARLIVRRPEASTARIRADKRKVAHGDRLTRRFLDLPRRPVRQENSLEFWVAREIASVRAVWGLDLNRAPVRPAFECPNAALPRGGLLDCALDALLDVSGPRYVSWLVCE